MSMPEERAGRMESARWPRSTSSDWARVPRLQPIVVGLLAWIEASHRQRSPLDLAYDRVRRLSESERDEVRARTE